jgi:hypothetical protein
VRITFLKILAFRRGRQGFSAKASQMVWDNSGDPIAESGRRLRSSVRR